MRTAGSVPRIGLACMINRAVCSPTFDGGFWLADRFPTPRGVERLGFLSDRVSRVAELDPTLSSSERASLLLAAQLIAAVRQGALERLAATN